MRFTLDKSKLSEVTGSHLYGLGTGLYGKAVPFVSVWQTTGASETITVPTRTGYDYDCTVDWGDGTIESMSGFDDSKWTHTYATADDYTVTISGTFECIYFNNGGDKLKIIQVVDVGNVGWKALDSAFHGCANITSFGGSYKYCSSITTLAYAWRDCSSATSFPDVDALTSVTTLYATWLGCSSATMIPVLMTASTTLADVISVFQGIGSGMGGTVVELWNTTNFPNITSHTDSFAGATGLSNYADIPNDWKGL